MEGSDLKITMEEPAAWARRLTITVPAERVERERKSAAQRIARQVRLPGFRKGKVPASVLEKRFGAAIQQQTLEKVVGDAYREALAQQNLQPITQGSVDQIDYAAGNDLTFNVDLEVRPEIALNRLGGFTVHRPALAVGDAEVDQVVERLRQEQAVWSPLEGEAPAAGDRVVVDITPIRSEEAAEPKPRRYEIVLGAGQAADPIEESIRTLQPGESGDFELELRTDPDDPNSPLEPHPVHIDLVEAKRPILPESDDAFAQSVGDFADVADLREKIRVDLEKEAAREADASVNQQLISDVIDANPFEVPRSMTDDYLRRVLPDQEGIPSDRLAEVRESSRGAAERSIRRALAIQRIAELESLFATAEEVDARVSDIANRLDRSAADVKAQLARSGRIHEIEEEITESKVFDYLKTLSTVE